MQLNGSGEAGEAGEASELGELSLSELKKPEDIERLDPRVFAMFVAAPANSLDMLRMRLEFQVALQRLSDSFEQSLKEVLERFNHAS